MGGSASARDLRGVVRSRVHSVALAAMPRPARGWSVRAGFRAPPAVWRLDPSGPAVHARAEACASCAHLVPTDEAGRVRVGMTAEEWEASWAGRALVLGRCGHPEAVKRCASGAAGCVVLEGVDVSADPSGLPVVPLTLGGVAVDAAAAGVLLDERRVCPDGRFGDEL